MSFTKQDKQELGNFFAESFKEVVLPVLEDMEERLASKKDLKAVEDSLNSVEGRLDRIEIKLTKIDDRLDRHGQNQEKLEKRVGVLESASL